MSAVFKVSFSEVWQYQGQPEPEEGTDDVVAVVADDAEHAIKRVREKHVGQVREWDDKDTNPPTHFKYEVVGLKVTEVTKQCDVDY